VVGVQWSAVSGQQSVVGVQRSAVSGVSLAPFTLSRNLISFGNLMKADRPADQFQQRWHTPRQRAQVKDLCLEAASTTR